MTHVRKAIYGPAAAAIGAFVSEVAADAQVLVTALVTIISGAIVTYLTKNDEA